MKMLKNPVDPERPIILFTEQEYTLDEKDGVFVLIPNKLLEPIGIPDEFDFVKTFNATDRNKSNLGAVDA